MLPLRMGTSLGMVVSLVDIKDSDYNKDDEEAANSLSELCRVVNLYDYLFVLFSGLLNKI